MLEIKLRPAEWTDCEELFNWRNDPETRRASFDNGMVDYDQHKKWLATTLASLTHRLIIAENSNGEKLGMIRFDLVGERFAEVSINLAPNMRGQGYGSIIITKACQEQAGLIFLARAKEANPASVRVFEKAGFARLFSYNDTKQSKIIVMGRNNG